MGGAVTKPTQSNRTVFKKRKHYKTVFEGTNPPVREGVGLKKAIQPLRRRTAVVVGGGRYVSGRYVSDSFGPQNEQEKGNDRMRIYTGRGTPIWLAERSNGGLIVQMGSSKIMLSREELPQFCDAIYRLTGIRADSVAVTPAKARIQRYPGTTP